MRRLPTADIERLSAAALAECVDLHAILEPRLPNGAPPPPLPDPGDYSGGRRAQAKHGLKFWVAQRDRRLEILGALLTDGKVSL